MKYIDDLHNFEIFTKRWSTESKYLLFGRSKECFQFIRTIDNLLGEGTLKIEGILDFEEESINSQNSMH